MIFDKNKKNKYFGVDLQVGFTLVETMIAISILMVAVVGPLTIAQKGLSSALYSKDQMIASYLAQDAIEYIKNKRDTNGLNKEGDWLFDLESCVQDVNDFDDDIGKICAIDTMGISSVAVNGSDNLAEQISDDGLIFYRSNSVSASGLSNSKFTREINIKRKVGNDEALITVKVYWNGAGSEGNSVTLRNYIYNVWENMDGDAPKL